MWVAFLAVAMWAGAAVAVGEGAPGGGPSAKPPELSAKLYVDQTAILPGGEVGLVLELSLSAPWHTYDPVILDTGLATTIGVVEAPPNLTLGPWQFPSPGLGEQFGLEYLEHSGTIRVLGSARLAKDAPADSPAKLRVEVRGLACIEQCVRVSAEASLELPVAHESTAANASAFEQARKALPRELGSAEFIDGSRIVVSHQKIPVGGAGELLLQVRVRKGHHIQHRDPGTEDLIASRVFIESVDGLVIKESEQVWPKAHVRDVPYIGKVNELRDTFVVAVPFRIADAKFAPRPLRLRVLFRYQVCTDKGQCYPPQIAVGTAEFEVVPEGQPAVVNPQYRELKPGAASAAVSAEPSKHRLEAGPTPEDRLKTGATADNRLETGATQSPLWYIFLFAFLGGMALNIMPCVLPVISLKILSFAKQSADSNARIFSLGLMYAVGVLASFAVLAVFIIATKSVWGGQMQSPTFVTILTAAIFAFALSLLGVFEMQLPGALQRAAAAGEHREGFGGAFLNGVLATAVATPCLAPGLGSAVGSLIALPPLVAAAGIMSVGAGLAFPYVLLTAFPAWLKALPRPGPWMETFKHLVGFVTMLVVVWLLWTLSALLDRGPFFAVLGTLVFVAVACWILGRVRLTDETVVVYRKWASAAAVVALGVWLSPLLVNLLSGGDTGGPIGGRTPIVSQDPSGWRHWQAGIGPLLAAEGHTVYIDYTADWCLTCKANKAAVLNTDLIKARFSELGIALVLADFTRANPEMQAEINAHGRNGVPLNLVYPAGKPKEPIVLPEVLTQATVLKALEAAGPSRVAQATQPAAAGLAKAR